MLNDEKALGRVVSVKILVLETFSNVQQFCMCKMSSTFSQNFFFVTFNLGRRLVIRTRTVAVCVSLPYGTLQTKKYGFLLTLG